MQMYANSSEVSKEKEKREGAFVVSPKEDKMWRRRRHIKEGKEMQSSKRKGSKYEAELYYCTIAYFLKKSSKTFDFSL